MFELADAVLADAVLTAPGPVSSLPDSSLEPSFRRGHGLVCQAIYFKAGRLDLSVACPSRTSPGPAGHRAHSCVLLSKCGNILVERLAALVSSPSAMFNRASLTVLLHGPLP